LKASETQVLFNRLPAARASRQAGWVKRRDDEQRAHPEQTTVIALDRSAGTEHSSEWDSSERHYHARLDDPELQVEVLGTGLDLGDPRGPIGRGSTKDRVGHVGRKSIDPRRREESVERSARAADKRSPAPVLVFPRGLAQEYDPSCGRAFAVDNLSSADGKRATDAGQCLSTHQVERI
jgi:hypothetical protein